MTDSDIRRERVTPPQKGNRIPTTRARSVPRRLIFVKAVAVSAIHYLGIFAVITALAVFFIEPSRPAMKFFILSLGFTVASWIVAFIRRRNTHCPLCKGTPLVESGALVHQRARRIFPFNHGVSTIFSILATQTFRCMYCGTLFDILKTPSHEISRQELEDGESYTPYNTYTSDEIE